MTTAQWGSAAAPVASEPVKQDKWWEQSGGIMGTPATYNPNDATAKADLSGQGYTAATGNSTGYDATKWNVDGKQTVQGQINDILNSGSPLMQKAETRANQQMNARGIMNSSMAVGAGQSALYDAALPIAQADAATNANSANFNANAANTAGQFTANATNQQSLVNQEAANRASEYGASATNQANAANQDATNRQVLANQDATNRAAEFGASATNQLQSQSNQIRQQAAQLDQEAGNKLLMQDLDNNFKVAISNADAQSKALLQQMSDATKADLAAMEATYKQLISSNEQAGALYGKTMQNITDIVNNPDIAAEDKLTAIENQKTLLKTGMGVVSAVSGLDLGSILTF